MKSLALRINSGPLLIFVSFFALFLLTLTANFTAPHDSLEYLNHIVKGHHFFHPNHLFYNDFTMYFVKVLHLLFPQAETFYLVEVVSALWNCATLAVLYMFFRNRFQLSTVIAVIGCAMVAFSYGIWFYSVNIEVYNPPIFFLITSLYILTKSSLKNRDFIAVFMLNIAAILFHQINILFVPVVVYKLWKSRDTIKWVPMLGLFALLGIVLVGGIYFYIGWVVQGNNSFDSWMHWMLGYARAEERGEYVRGLSMKTPILATIGLVHAFIGGHFVFKVSFVESYLDNTLKGHTLQDETYLVHNMSSSTALLLLVCTTVGFSLMFLLVLRIFKKRKAIWAADRTILSPILQALLIYSVFFCFWMPEILEFWLFQCILILLLVFGVSRHLSFPFKSKPAYYLGFTAILLFVVNFFGSIYYLQNINNDIGYKKIEKIKAMAKPDDLIVLRDYWLIDNFIMYYTASHLEDVPYKSEDDGKLNAKIDQTLSSGNKVYLFTDASSPVASPNEKFVETLLKSKQGKWKVLQEEFTKIILIEP